MAPSGLASPRSNISGYKQTQTPNMTPEAIDFYRRLLGRAGKGAKAGANYFSGLAAGDEDAFAELEAPAHRAFQEKLGEIGTRYAGMGAIGSSAFQNATSGEAAKFAEELGAQRHGIRSKAINDLFGLSQDLFSQRPYEYGQQQDEQGFDWGALAKLLAKLGITYAGGYFGGPAGAAGASKVGSELLG